MVKAADELETPSQPFMYDLVDLTRQLLANTFNDLYMLSANATAELRNQSLIPLSNAALGLLKDLDALLATDTNFLLGQWIERARSWATESGAEADQFEFNARNQLTLWGPDGEINDYAAKQWAGLVGNYYYMRWSMYFRTLSVSLLSVSLGFQLHPPLKKVLRVLRSALGCQCERCAVQ